MTEKLHRNIWGTLPNPTNPFKIWNWWCTGEFHIWSGCFQTSKTKSSDLLKFWSFSMRKKFHKLFQLMCPASWRNGSASDFSSEGCVFNSCRGQNECLQLQLPSWSWRHCSVKTHCWIYNWRSFFCLFVQEQLYLSPKLPKPFLATNWTLWQNCVICFLITSGSMNFWGCLFRKHVGQNYGASRVVK